MSGRAYLVVAALCAAYLGARAATQPASFDFDASAHLGTIAQVRQFGGLAPAERFPEIVFNLPRGVTYHHLPPLPYLLMASVTGLGQTEPTAAGVLGVARAFSALFAVVTVLSAGVAARNLHRAGIERQSGVGGGSGREDDGSWTAAAVVTAGLTLMPSLHAMGASATTSTWAFASVGLTTAATTWAMRCGWSRGATIALAACAAFVVAVRPTAYPVLLLIPLAMLAAGLSPRAAAPRLGIIAAVALAVNSWWLIRQGLVTGDPLGTVIHVQQHLDGSYPSTIRESPLWPRADAPWPQWTLVTSSDWLWVALSRMLVRQTWIDPLTLALWAVLGLAPAVVVVAARIRGERAAWAAAWPYVVGGLAAAASAFAAAVTLSAQVGWYAYLRDMFILSLPLAVAIAALAAARPDRLRTICFTAGLIFAAAANAGYLLVVLS